MGSSVIVFLLILVQLISPSSAFRVSKLSFGTQLNSSRLSKTCLHGTKYRLWDETTGILALGPLGKPVGKVLNVVGDLLRIQGEYSEFIPEIAKQKLANVMKNCGKNGVKASKEQRLEIAELVKTLEASNPTRRPAYSEKMNGYWRLLYTDFSPAAPSSGQLGPFVGDVFQDLDGKNNIIKNILKISFPPIDGALVAKQRIKDDVTWEITFDFVSNSIFGFKTPTKKFNGKETRLWEITYLDQDLRIMRARRPESAREDAFIFVLIREGGGK